MLRLVRQWDGTERIEQLRVPLPSLAPSRSPSHHNVDLHRGRVDELIQGMLQRSSMALPEGRSQPLGFKRRRVQLFGGDPIGHRPAFNDEEGSDEVDEGDERSRRRRNARKMSDIIGEALRIVEDVEH